jgi:hypothetical protein
VPKTSSILACLNKCKSCTVPARITRPRLSLSGRDTWPDCRRADLLAWSAAQQASRRSRFPTVSTPTGARRASF